MSDNATLVWEFLQKQFFFIIAAVTAVVTFVKYVTKKHDEHYNDEIKRLDTKIDTLKELLITKIEDIKEWFKRLQKY